MNEEPETMPVQIDFLGQIVVWGVINEEPVVISANGLVPCKETKTMIFFGDRL